MNKDVVQFYFTHKGENKWTCRCGRSRKQELNKGYSNLMSHITIDHPEWKIEFTAGKTKRPWVLPKLTKRDTIYTAGYSGQLWGIAHFHG